jgi:hypothetical protein
MKLLRRMLALLGALILGMLAAAAYLIAFSLRLLSAILAVLTIMMATADHSARRGNRMRAFYRMRSRGRGTGL